MTFNMRFSILFLFLLITLHSPGQDAAFQIKTKWLYLKTQLQNRAKVVNELTKALSKLKIDKKQIDNLKSTPKTTFISN